MPYSTEPLPMRFKAYVSEPITRCPPREKGRIKTLIQKMAKALAEPPYGVALYIPSLVTSPEVRAEMHPEHVYLLDRIRVVEADFMLVLADHTSFGIGGEVEMATSLGKPVLFFSREENLSRFLIGTPANTVHDYTGSRYFLHYRDWRDLKPQLMPLVERVMKETDPEGHQTLPFWDVGKQLRRLRALKGMSLEDLANRTGLRAAQLLILEKSIDEIRRELAAYKLDLGSVSLTPHQLEQLANIGLPALHKLAMVLEVPLGELFGDRSFPVTAKGPSREAASQLEELEKTRNDSLKIRSAQYDVTFREYERLYELLVEPYLDNPIRLGQERARGLRMISEQDFLNALAQVRG